MIFGAAAIAALAITPMATATAQDITVTGPRATIVPNSGSMMQLSVLTDSMVVNYSDLDLTTFEGRASLQKRVDWAARHVCNRLDDLNRDHVPLTGPQTDQCMIYSKAFTQPQVQRAVTLYGQ
jgi:UrcA family protein